MGYTRERTPFVFTPAFASVLGGEDSPAFASFENYCVQAFMILRRSASIIFSYFELSLIAGLPELCETRQLLWLEEKLMLNISDTEAAEVLRKLIKTALHTRATQLNDAVHLLRVARQDT
jgi:phosphatidylinositol kinase/protein kinase (PI-3  family)